MKANINNISYINDENGYHIITEFSKLPIESFETQQEAQEFINGYLGESTITDAELKGEMFRNFVEIDLLSGIEYKKVREIKMLEMAI